VQENSIHNYIDGNSTVRNQDPIELALYKHTKDGRLETHRETFSPSRYYHSLYMTQWHNVVVLYRESFTALKLPYSENLILIC